MPEVVVLLLAATATAFATGLGAIPVFLFGRRTEAATPFLLGFAGGVMAVAALSGLLVPAFEEGTVSVVAAGLAVGVAFLAIARRYLSADARLHGPAGPRCPGIRSSSSWFSSFTACRRGWRWVPRSPLTGRGSASS
jgi:zinc transporter ZupT